MRLLHVLLSEPPHGNRPVLCLLRDGQILPLSKLPVSDWNGPLTLDAVLPDWMRLSEALRELEHRWAAGNWTEHQRPFAGARVLAPVLNPPSYRDGYAFREHVETARRNRGLEMVPEFDAFPVFYFSNAGAMQGPGRVGVQDRHLPGLDYELEVAAVIGRAGRNLKAHLADAHIAGFAVLNDLSARGLQMEEMKLSLGPAKGKDFATAWGPCMVTPDELEPWAIAPQPGHVGKAYALEMKAFLNGELLSHGSLGSMNWTFAELLERVSYGVDLRPGEVLGSGTVGKGCLLELNGTARWQNPAHTDRWLQPGDHLRLEVEALGSLENELVLVPEDSSQPLPPY